ncbi:MAG: hypothetical protein RH860_16635 [Cytophagales bacterium]
MKKSFFSLAFLSLIFFASSKITYSQSLSTFFQINISDDRHDINQKEEIAVDAIEENGNPETFKKSNDSEALRTEKSVTQPISSRISIGLGKALFEKYIK